jgi:hypothetical protein
MLCGVYVNITEDSMFEYIVFWMYNIIIVYNVIITFGKFQRFMV